MLDFLGPQGQHCYRPRELSPKSFGLFWHQKAQMTLVAGESFRNATQHI